MYQNEEGYLSHLRLNQGDAVQIVTQLAGLGVEQASALAMLEHPKSYPPPVSRRLPSSVQLQELRQSIVDLARQRGFPKRASKSKYSEFDAELGNLLLSRLRITPAEAGVEEVWSFLTLVLVPDVATWRFPNDSRNPEYERWIGKPRNILRKAWWRAFILGPDLNLQIGEDEGVNIMERPTFGFNPVIARYIVQNHVRLSAQVNYPRSELLRRVMVQLGKISTIANLDSLEPVEIDHLIKEIYNQTITDLPPLE